MGFWCSGHSSVSLADWALYLLTYSLRRYRSLIVSIGLDAASCTYGSTGFDPAMAIDTHTSWERRS